LYQRAQQTISDNRVFGPGARISDWIAQTSFISVQLDPPQTTDDKNSKSTERTRLLLSSFRDRFLPVRVLSFRALKTDGAFGSAQLRPGASTSARRKEKRSAPAPE
jgi:hypothetical protein